MDYKSGSLNITNITAEHTGVYEVELIRRESAGTSQSLNRNPKCDSTKVILKMSTIGQIIKTYHLSIKENLVEIDKNSDIKTDANNSFFITGTILGIIIGLMLLSLITFLVIKFRTKIREKILEKIDLSIY